MTALADRRAIVIAVDGPRLAAAVVAADGDSVALERRARADAPRDDHAALEAALDRALGELRRDGARAPRAAYVVTDEAAASRIEIPVDPARPLPSEKLSALVRWELETDLALRAGGGIGNGDSVVGYTPAAGAARTPGRHAWLAAGMPRSTRDRWRASLARRGLSLGGVYPAAAPGGPAEGGGGAAPREEGDPDGGEAPPALLEAARHALGLPGGERTVAVPPRDPAPPLLRRRSTPLLLCAAVLALGIAAAEVLDARALERARAARDAEAAASRASPVPVPPPSPELEARLRADLAEIAGKVAFLGKTVPARDALVNGLLGAFAAAATPEVAIDHMREGEPDRFTVEGFALDEGSAQRFVRALAEGVAPLGLVVGEPAIRGGSGRLGLLGYSVRFDLAPAAAGPHPAPSAPAAPPEAGPSTPRRRP